MYERSEREECKEEEKDHSLDQTVSCDCIGVAFFTVYQVRVFHVVIRTYEQQNGDYEERQRKICLFCGLKLSL